MSAHNKCVTACVLDYYNTYVYTSQINIIITKKTMNQFNICNENNTPIKNVQNIIDLSE